MAARVGSRLRASAYSGPHRDPEAAPLRLHHPHPLADARPSPPTTPGRSPRPPAGCSPTPGPAAACGCSGSASPGCRSTRRATCSPSEDEPLPRRDRRRRTRRTVAPEADLPVERRWWPGQDVRHDELGAGWVWGRGLGRVTVRFEGPRTAPGPVRTLAADDPAAAARPTRPTGGRAREAVTEPSTWMRMTEENPRALRRLHPAVQGPRGAGHGPGGGGAAGRRDAGPRVAGAGRRLRAPAGSAATSPRSGHDVVGVDGDPVLDRRGRGGAPGAALAGRRPGRAGPARPRASPSRSTRSSAPATSMTFLAPSTRGDGAAPAARAPAARRTGRDRLRRRPRLRLRRLPRRRPRRPAGRRTCCSPPGTCGRSRRTPTSWSLCCGAGLTLDCRQRTPLARSRTRPAPCGARATRGRPRGSSWRSRRSSRRRAAGRRRAAPARRRPRRARTARAPGRPGAARSPAAA